MSLNIALTYDLRDEYRKLGYSEEAIAEFDSEATIAAIEAALKSLGYQPDRIGNLWKLTEALAAGKRWDLVFNIAEGLFGLAREAQVPALLEAYQIPYVFSPPEVMIWCHHKAMAKQIVRMAGLATADWWVVKSREDILSLQGEVAASERSEVQAAGGGQFSGSLPSPVSGNALADLSLKGEVTLCYPLFAKPLAEGTSKGISQKSLVHNAAELRVTCTELLTRFNQPVLVETYLPGQEFTVGIVGDEVIGAVELKQARGGETAARTYDNKEKYETAEDYLLVVGETAQAACDLALAAWRALGCRDGGRVDIRCDAKGVPHFIEANPLAGMKPGHSDLPVLAQLAGISYEALIGRMVDSARKRMGKDARRGVA